MLCVVIQGPTIEEAHKQLTQARTRADMAELRLDLFSSRDLSSLLSLRAACPMPTILTLRHQSHGGMYHGSWDEWAFEVQGLLPLHPEYIDVETDCPLTIVSMLSRSTKIILSYHNFDATPDDLDGLLSTMMKTPASLYKISVMARTAIDALRLLCWSKGKPNLTAMSMGPHGHASRILGPILGFPITYASLEEGQETASGQLPISILLDRYHVRSLHPGSSIYGLVGDPVDKSVSDLSHNPLCQQLGLDAVYIKMQVKAEELPLLLPYAKQLPFQGLSVTRPLKEAVLPYLDAVEPGSREIGAVNTICFRGGKSIGSNTDSVGALNALERSCPVRDHRVLILGAGGAAKAIAYEAQRRGALVTLVGRTPDRVKAAADWLNCEGVTLDRLDEQVSKGYEIIINATPDFMPIATEQIIPKCVAMDIHTRPKMTLFLQEAAARGCTLVYGYSMFIEQAVLQWVAWRPEVNREACRAILETRVAPILL